MLARLIVEGHTNFSLISNVKLPAPQKRRVSSAASPSTGSCEACNVPITSSGKLCSSKCTLSNAENANNMEKAPLQHSTRTDKTISTIQQTIESFYVSAEDERENDSGCIDSRNRSRWSRSDTMQILFTGIPEVSA